MSLPSDLAVAKWYVSWVCTWGLIADYYVAYYYESRERIE
jgi:hypothetical protein